MKETAMPTNEAEALRAAREWLLNWMPDKQYHSDILTALILSQRQSAVAEDRAKSHNLLMELSRVVEKDGTIWNGDVAAIALVVKLEKRIAALEKALRDLDDAFIAAEKSYGRSIWTTGAGYVLQPAVEKARAALGAGEKETEDE